MLVTVMAKAIIALQGRGYEYDFIQKKESLFYSAQSAHSSKRLCNH
jgi:hypothetical protein